MLWRRRPAEPDLLIVTTERSSSADPDRLRSLAAGDLSDLLRRNVLLAIPVPDLAGWYVVVSRTSSGRNVARMTRHGLEDDGTVVLRDELHHSTWRLSVNDADRGRRLRLEQRMRVPRSQHSSHRDWLRSHGTTWLTRLDDVAAGRDAEPANDPETVCRAVPRLTVDSPTQVESRVMPTTQQVTWDRLLHRHSSEQLRRFFWPPGEVRPGSVEVTVSEMASGTRLRVRDFVTVEEGSTWTARELTQAPMETVAVLQPHDDGTLVQLTVRYTSRTRDTGVVEAMTRSLDGIERALSASG